MRRRTHSGPDGYTLIEQLMVMFIIGIILALVIGLSRFASLRADESLARAELESFRNAVNDYVVALGRVPGVDDLSTPAFRKGLPNAFSFEDPWGHGYLYESNSTLSFTVLSTGPDGARGTRDDVYPGFD